MVNGGKDCLNDVHPLVLSDRLYTCHQVYFISATYVQHGTRWVNLRYANHSAKVQFIEISSDACCDIALEIFLKKKKTLSFLNERSLFLGFINVVITVMHFSPPAMQTGTCR